MKRGLPQSIIDKGHRAVSLHDTFLWECRWCGACCFCCEIVLTPYDVFRLCYGRRLTTGEFLQGHARVEIGPNSGLPICSLDFEKVQRLRGGNEEDAPCPFLAWGERFRCSVCPYRPSCCRSFPLFRMGKPGEDLKLYLQEVFCLAAETDKEHTVSEWIGREGLGACYRQNDLFLKQMVALAGEGGPVWPPWFVSMLSGLWYNFSAFPGRRLNKKYASAMRVADLTVKAMVLLREEGGDIEDFDLWRSELAKLQKGAEV